MALLWSICLGPQLGWLDKLEVAGMALLEPHVRGLSSSPHGIYKGRNVHGGCFTHMLDT